MNKITPMDIAPGRVRDFMIVYNTLKILARDLTDEEIAYLEHLQKRMEDGE